MCQDSCYAIKKKYSRCFILDDKDKKAFSVFIHEENGTQLKKFALLELEFERLFESKLVCEIIATSLGGIAPRASMYLLNQYD